MDPHEVGRSLVAGLTARGVAASFEVEEMGNGRWSLFLDFEPDGAWFEGMRGTPTMRLEDEPPVDLTLEQALDACLDEAGGFSSPARSSGPRRRRPVAAGVCGLLTVLAVLLGVLASLWFLIAVPFTLIAGYGARAGLSNGEILDAMGREDDDPGAGTPGLMP